MLIGQAVHTRRLDAGLSLEALARRSGVSRAMLSDVERDRKSPTIRVGCQIAEGLGCTLSDLLGETPRGAIAVLRGGEQPVVIDPKSGVERHLLSPELGARGIEVVRYVLPRSRATGTFPAHRAGVFEHITVMSGRIGLTIGHERLLLASGDSVSYPADTEHEFSAVGARGADVLLVIDSTQVKPSARTGGA